MTPIRHNSLPNRPHPHNSTLKLLHRSPNAIAELKLKSLPQKLLQRPLQKMEAKRERRVPLVGSEKELISAVLQEALMQKI